MIGILNPKVDDYLSKAVKWPKEMEHLRRICLECGLTEELKWGAPCYTYQNGNVAIIGEFKEYCIIGFFKGALLFDAERILVKPGEHTQSGRQVRFTTVKEILRLESVLKSYLYEAIEVEKAGIRVRTKTTEEYPVPEELTLRFKSDRALKKAFEALSPGRQRGYLLYFSAPKLSKTRDSRIDKYVDHILQGKGILDDYLNASKTRKKK